MSIDSLFLNENISKYSFHNLHDRSETRHSKQHSSPLDHLMLVYQFSILIIISNRWSLSDRI